MIINTDKIIYKDILPLFLIEDSKFQCSAMGEDVEDLASYTDRAVCKRTRSFSGDGSGAKHMNVCSVVQTVQLSDSVSRNFP